MNEKMTLTERLRNPQWVGVPGERAALDVEQTTGTMIEAADVNERLRQIISEALVHAEQCWLGHYGENPEGGAEPHHIQSMRAALIAEERGNKNG